MEQPQILQYVPVLMLGALAVVFSFGMLILSVVLGQKGKRSKIKDTPYECGMLPVGEGMLAAFSKVLFGGDAVHPVRHRSRVSLPVGGHL